MLEKQHHLIQFGLCFGGATPDNSQELILVLCSRVTPVKALGPNVMPGREVRSVVCKASALLFLLYNLCGPHMNFFFFLPGFVFN